MTENEKEKGIVIQGPSEFITHPDKRAKIAKEKALEEERFGVLQISDKMGTYFSASMLVAGVLLLGVFAHVMLVGLADWITLSPDMPFVGLLVWVLISIINIFGGLLLMGSK